MSTASGPAGRSLPRRLLSRPGSAVGLGLVTVVCVAVVLAPWLAPDNPLTPDYLAVLHGPSAAHWLGTDDLGRDELSRLLYGGRATLKVSFLGIVAAAGGGTVIGVLAGYFGGIIDAVFMRVVDMWLAFPVLLLLLSIVAVLGPGLTTITIAIGIGGAPAYARVARGSTLAICGREYMTASRLSGAGDIRRILGHVLPNVAGVLIVYATLGWGAFIIAVAGLDFLGLGAQPPAPEWGAMLASGDQYLTSAWWMSVFPGLAIFLTVLGLNLLGAGLRDLTDPRAARTS
jgi:peptide/nickel transport system permease protein